MILVLEISLKPPPTNDAEITVGNNNILQAGKCGIVRLKISRNILFRNIPSEFIQFPN